MATRGRVKGHSSQHPRPRVILLDGGAWLHSVRVPGELAQPHSGEKAQLLPQVLPHLPAMMGTMCHYLICIVEESSGSPSLWDLLTLLMDLLCIHHGSPTSHDLHICAKSQSRFTPFQSLPLYWNSNNYTITKLHHPSFNLRPVDFNSFRPSFADQRKKIF